MRIAKFIFRALVVAIWATVAYACVDRIGQEIVDPGPVPVDGGASDPGRPGHRGVGDLARSARLEERRDSGEHPASGRRDPRIGLRLAGP